MLSSFCWRVCARIHQRKLSVSSAQDELTRHGSVLLGRKYCVGQPLGRGAFGEVRLGNSLSYRTLFYRTTLHTMWLKCCVWAVRIWCKRLLYGNGWTDRAFWHRSLRLSDTGILGIRVSPQINNISAPPPKLWTWPHFLGFRHGASTVAVSQIG